MLALSLQNLTKTYKNGVQALKGIDLQVEEGDFFALLGPNGAGKTTAIGIVTSLVNKSGETLGEIVDSVKRVTDIIAEMAAATGEQSSGIDQVNRAVGQMDTITQANAAQTEELSSTAQSLAGQARQLHDLVGTFKVDTHWTARVAAAAIPPAPPAGAPKPAPEPVKAPAPKMQPALAGSNGHAHNGHAHNGYAAPSDIDGFEEF